MSQQKDSNPNDDLVFYVDEEGDDYTFYLARDKENTVFRRLDWAKMRERLKTGSSYKSPPGEEFSFSERVTIKRLDEIKDDFWPKLKRPISRSQYSYLIKAMKKQAAEKSRSVIEYEKKIGEKAEAVLKNLKPGKSLSKGDKQRIRPLLALTLNECIHKDNLKNKPWSRNLLTEKEKKILTSSVDEEKQREWNPVFIERAFPELQRKPERCRALICFSYAGKYLSVTVRKLKEESGYKASFLTENEQEKRKQYLFSRGEYCQQIYEPVFGKDSTQHAHGLLVVTGSTNSLKSEIARGLIDWYLTKKNKGNRRHHLVTFEDPIEKFYADEDIKGHPYVAVALSRKPDDINYTPRQKQKDVGLLKDALTDALRQTPAVFFVGETREKEEWEVLLDFAATGHLIVTTAHAGSLVEAMHKIFAALEVKTPADRSEIANKLLGVIHLRAGTLVFESKKAKGKKEDAKRSTNALFPALWRRTPRGIAALTSDGLASLLPSRPKSIDKNNSENEPSCLGRRWFIEQLVEKTSEDLNGVFQENLHKPFGSGKQQESMETQAYNKATEWDLLGV